MLPSIPSNKGMLNSIPQSRVELHVHLDGSVRCETIWELAKEKNLPLPGNGTFKELQDAMVIRDPQNLFHFLQPFLISTPCIAGDLSAIERVAYEFTEDKAKNGVLYVEARYSPHLLLKSDGPSDIAALSDVVNAINKGFTRGQSEFKIKVRSILCAMVGLNKSREVLELCELFQDEGVVAIDMATLATSDPDKYIEVPDSGEEVTVFEEAYRKGIHRTVHAGESGPAEMVRRAVELYHAERIGHGYHILEDETLYQTVRQRGIHFENCPWSSYLTGSVPLATAKHPIVQFAEDGANFSINTDDPTVTGYELQSDYELANTYLGLTEAHLVRANLNAARSCFLPDAEKEQLISDLKQIYGFDQ